MRIDRFKMTVELMKKDFTLKKLSELSGVSRQTVIAVKNGKSCSEETAVKIAKALGVAVQDIIE